MLDANKIYQIYKDKGYVVDMGEGVVNITYIEGLNPDGGVNPHTPNHFDDLRVVWTVLSDGTAKVLGAWEATTRPSTYWTVHPMNPSGAFIIALGQQACWRMGQYHDQIALLQVEPINGTRDFNKDYDRRGDRVYPPGLYGIHHHWGYNYPHDDAGRSSAGCQVGRTKDGHNEFISILKKDPRYVANKSLLWTSTVIPASDYSGSRVVIPVVAASTVAAAGLGVMSYWTPIHDQILSYWHLVW